MSSQKTRRSKRHQRKPAKPTGLKRFIQLIKLPITATLLTLLMTYSGGQATKCMLNRIIDNQQITEKTITDYTTVSTTLQNIELREKLQAKLQDRVNHKEPLFPEQEIEICNELVEETHLPEAYVLRAMFWAANGHNKQAMEDLDKAEAKAPGSIYTLKGRGMVYLFQQQFAKALECFRKVLDHNPIDWSAYQQIIHIYLLNNRPQQVIKILKKRTALFPTDTLSQLTLSFALLKTNAFTEARNIIIPILEHNPDNALGHLYLGDMARMENNYRDAITHYNLAEACDQTGIKFLCMINRAGIYYQTGDYSRAEQIYMALHGICPNDTMPLEQLSNIAIIHKKYDLAEQYLGKINIIDSTAKNYGNKLKVCFKLYGADSATRLSEYWLRNNPDDPDAMHAVSFMKYWQGRPCEAARLHHRILNMDPTNTTAILELAQLAYEEGNAREGLKRCNQALQYDSLDYKSYHLRGIIYLFISKDFNRALRDFKTCVRLNRKSSHAHFGCGFCHFLQGDQKSAIAHFNESYALDSVFYKSMINKINAEVPAWELNLYLNETASLSNVPPQDNKVEFESYFYSEPSQTNNYVTNNGYVIRSSAKNKVNLINGSGYNR